MKIRILINNEKGLWSAMSLDLGLAAQAGCYDDARDKLLLQVYEYIGEACTIDKKHKKALLSRKGPIQWFFMYYLSPIINVICKIKKNYNVKTFTTTSTISG